MTKNFMREKKKKKKKKSELQHLIKMCRKRGFRF